MARTRRPVHILIRAGANSLTPDHVRRQAALAEEVLGYSGISTVGVWPGEDPEDVWDADDKLSTRHFTVAPPDTANATIDLLRSLMERWSQ